MHVHSDAVRVAILEWALTSGFGAIPDVNGPEDWFHLSSIATMLGIELSTLRNRMPRRIRPQEHPIGGYYKLSQVIEALSNGKTTEDGDDQETSERRRKHLPIQGQVESLGIFREDRWGAEA